MPYSKINPESMILRDHLAYDRTVLANERTLLSYMRTAIALFIAGGTLVKVLHEELAMLCLGIALLIVGSFVMVGGVHRFSTVRKRLAKAYEVPPEPIHDEGQTDCP